MSDGDSCRLKYFEGEPEVLAEVRQMKYLMIRRNLRIIILQRFVSKIRFYLLIRGMCWQA